MLKQANFIIRGGGGGGDYLTRWVEKIQSTQRKTYLKPFCIVYIKARDLLHALIHTYTHT